MDHPPPPQLLLRLHTLLLRTLGPVLDRVLRSGWVLNETLTHAFQPWYGHPKSLAPSLLCHGRV